tara:strand:+ start:196 stop:318 length:123 start_codon:yes stop_codon:yes gene_type:complete
MGVTVFDIGELSTTEKPLQERTDEVKSKKYKRNHQAPDSY